MPSILSERIAALRKERGLTQEQLGKMCGVSSQAVGKWEKGGAPDVELLPILAQQLGVTIDALFGLEAGERVDMVRALKGWLRSFPEKERLEKLCRLIWDSIGSFLYEKVEVPHMEYLKNCRQSIDGTEQLQLMYSGGRSESGILMDVHAEDMAFVTLWPEPDGGYAAYFPSMESCRRLFAVLAKPNCLEVLDALGRQKCGFFLPEVLSEKIDLPAQEVIAILEDLREVGTVWSMSLETREGDIKAYKVSQPLRLVPFIMAAQAFIETTNNYLYRYDEDIPLLRGAKWKKTEDKSHEKT